VRLRNATLKATVEYPAMTARDEAERALIPWTAPPRSRLPFPGFLAAVIAIGGMQFVVIMDGSIALVAIPKIQNELRLSDAGLSWVITAYMLSFGGLMLLGGRLGDTFGRKRTFIVGVVLFTIASVMCGIAWNEGSLVVARLLHGAAAAIIVPTSVALVATTFPKGPARNAATAVFAAVSSVSMVASLVVGAALTAVSWRLAFLVNVPIGLLVIYLARTLPETQQARMKLDATGAVLATLGCIAVVFGFSMGPQKGWISAPTIVLGVVALAAFAAFAVVERTAENPVVPFSLFFERNRVATFATIFLAGGVLFTLTVLIGLYVQIIMGYDPLRTGVAFIPFVIAVAIGTVASSRLVTRFPPRVLVIAGGIPVVGAMLYSSTFDARIPYFPNLVLLLVIGGIGIGVINVPLMLSVIASAGVDLIGPTSAIALMLQNLGGPVVLAVIQAVITSRTLSLGGTNGPVKSMNPAQLHALDHGYTYGLLWLTGVAILVGGLALLIGYTTQQVAYAQEVKNALDAEKL
jgi:EmrB/QacA subfamily drug resistance transporter